MDGLPKVFTNAETPLLSPDGVTEKNHNVLLNQDQVTFEC